MPFGSGKLTGYVVGTSDTSKITRVKPILGIIDEIPVVSPQLLLLARRIAGHYCCSWGQAIDSVLPQDLRKGRKVTAENGPKHQGMSGKREKILFRCPDSASKWAKYLEYIKNAQKAHVSAILLLADKSEVLRAQGYIAGHLGVEPVLMSRGQRDELKVWLTARDSGSSVILGTRSAVFAPARDLGLIIVDDEENPVYKQEQPPHYHARDVAIMRADIENTQLILGGVSVSLESYYLSTRNKIKYSLLPAASKPAEVKLVNARFTTQKAKEKSPLSKYLQDCIYSALAAKKRVLLFINRRGFATYAACLACGFVLKCPRCALSLVYHQDDHVLTCSHCNFSTPSPKICPKCSAGYIKYSGTGTEKIESVLAGIFPGAKMRILDTGDSLDGKVADIYISAASVFKEADRAFDLVGLLQIDNTLNRVDLRSGEKVMSILLNLSRLAKEKLVIETNFPAHHAFAALVLGDIDRFYVEELKQRRQLRFAPWRHMIALRLRGKIKDKVEQAAAATFDGLNKALQVNLKVLSLNPGSPPKLRDNYYWQILLSCSNLDKANIFLKSYLKNFRHSGIIVTVDVEPV